MDFFDLAIKAGFESSSYFPNDLYSPYDREGNDISQFLSRFAYLIIKDYEAEK